jgi:L1 cell adhesion molecule like protein
MVHNAENYLHKKIKKLVITVPAYFSENQKKLTSQAAEMLNLDVIKIINEPTAAALAYGFTEDQSKDKNILVFDLGGGTFDVSILSFESEKDNNENVNTKNLSVLSTSGDMHLGGEDFDNALVDFVIEKQKIDKKMIRKNNQAIKRLKVACENIKKILSKSDKTTLRINNILDKVDINVDISKTEFENICKPLIQRLEIPLNNAIAEARKKMQILKKHFSENNIDEIILVGGSTRIPMVKKFVKNFFKTQKINDTINPDEAVAYGATLQAEKILYNRDKIISNFHILDITPFSLGVATKNNSNDEELQKEGLEMSVIIKRGTPLPTFNIQTYETVKNNQTIVELEIYEGEKKYVKYNHLLTKTTITGLSPKPKGETKISVEFKIDVNGILYVKAIEESEKNGKKIELTIKNDDISFSNEEMEKNEEKKWKK